MNFTSDNAACVAPEILAALAAVNEGYAAAYGNDPVTARAEQALRSLFECDLVMLPVATGTAANALALSALAPPYGAVYCHRNAHIEEDECGAPEFYTGGAKLVLLDGPHGKLDAAALAAALERAGPGVEHHVQPAAVSLTQATEAGTIYRPEEIGEIAAVARRAGLPLHMDGARFANAVVSLGCSPAEASWRAGVDVLSFGATKNGAMAAEAVLFFRPEQARDIRYRRKRAGHLFSKMRYLSAQLEAYATDGLWRRNAAHANEQARALAGGLASLPGAELVHPVEANEIFVRLPEAVIAGMVADGVGLHRWGPTADRVVRLVTAFDTDPADVARALGIAARHAGGSGSGNP